MQLRPIQQSLPMRLLQAREAAMSRFRPMLRAHGLTEQQWRVIRVLAAEVELDTGELAEHSFLLGPSLTRILQALEADNLILRKPDKNDQRRYRISLSQSGKARYHQVSPDSEALYQKLEQAFGKDKLAELYDLLEELSVSAEAL